MQRKIYKQLINWKKALPRKPILLQGARQVGKTYCLNKLGSNEFLKYQVFDFMENPGLTSLKYFSR